MRVTVVFLRYNILKFLLIMVDLLVWEPVNKYINEIWH